MKENKVFFDSNILVYFMSEDEPEKRDTAEKILSEAINNNNGLISTQSLQEFYNVVTKKKICSPEKAKIVASSFADSFYVHNITPKLIFHAIDISIKNKLSFWDSLIVSAAEDCGANVLFSEDLNGGQQINGVKILNPFAA